MNEDRLLKIIKEKVGEEFIGDDVAFIKWGDEFLLYTVDVLVENVHFKKDWDPYMIGWKTVSVNVSDISAKGGNPLYCLVSLGIKGEEDGFLEKLYEGIRDASEEFGLKVVGGNLSYSRDIFIDLFMVGVSPRRIERGGFEKGEKVVLYGNLGMSRAGLEVLLEGKDRDKWSDIIDIHFKPKTSYYIREHIRKYATASIDISDGLVIDLYRMVERGKYGINLHKDKVERIIKDPLKRYCKHKGCDPLEYVLYGGEDYAVIFTQKKSEPLPTGAEVIGEVVEERAVLLDGKPLERKGFDHFEKNY